MIMSCPAGRGPRTCFTPAYLLLIFFYKLMPNYPFWQVPCLSQLLKGEHSKLLLYNLTLHGLL